MVDDQQSRQWLEQRAGQPLEQLSTGQLKRLLRAAFDGDDDLQAEMQRITAAAHPQHQRRQRRRAKEGE